MEITITEALAKIKTIQKRIDKKLETLLPLIGRQAAVSDPVTDPGGSPEFVKRTRQSIDDLMELMVNIRTAIQVANQSTHVTICGQKRSVSAWLNWKREVASIHQNVLRQIGQRIHSMRSQAQQQQWSVVDSKESVKDRSDLVMFINEAEVGRESERVEEILGELDGQLTLVNSTVKIVVDDPDAPEIAKAESK